MIPWKPKIRAPAQRPFEIDRRHFEGKKPPSIRPAAKAFSSMYCVDYRRSDLPLNNTRPAAGDRSTRNSQKADLLMTARRMNSATSVRHAKSGLPLVVPGSLTAQASIIVTQAATATKLPILTTRGPVFNARNEALPRVWYS